MTDHSSKNFENYITKTGVLNVDLVYLKSIDHVDLKRVDSILLIGKEKDLNKFDESTFNNISKQLNIPSEWIKNCIGNICRKSTIQNSDENKQNSFNNVSWLNKLLIYKIPDEYSRHNTPSRSHFVAKTIKDNCYGQNQLIIVACEQNYSFAYSNAIARVFPLYSCKTKQNSVRTVSVAFNLTDKNQSELTDEEISCFSTLSESIRLSAKVVDTPCANMNTDDFLNEIKKVGVKLGIKPFVVEGEELKSRGFGGLYNVGKAALCTPKLVVLSSIKDDAKRTIAWVGKGIVYDTGGLCLKSRPNMLTMKVDCGGAASVLGAFYSAVKLGFKDNLHAVFCLAENAIGPLAVRPDDVITLYSGKTIEITNTDAEGRLVLGDGVAYAKNDLNADVILDIATLTGAQGPATGKYHAGLVTNSEEWENACVDSGKLTGELCFPLVFTPEFHLSEFDSEIADLKNSVSKPDNATSSCAGLFIYSQLLCPNYEKIWIHLDIASPVLENERATGYGVGLLNILFGESSENEFIKKISRKREILPLKL